MHLIRMLGFDKGLSDPFLFRVKNNVYYERIKCASERRIRRVSQKTGTEMEIRLNRFATGGLPRKREPLHNDLG